MKVTINIPDGMFAHFADRFTFIVGQHPSLYEFETFVKEDIAAIYFTKFYDKSLDDAIESMFCVK